MSTLPQRVSVSSFAVAALVSAAVAQTPTFREDVKLVQIYATVFDHGGHTVGGLTRDQFEVRDDGTPQPIRVFEPSEQALSCALLLDTTGSMTTALPILRNAARVFVEALRPGDAVAIYSFTDHLDELSEMTSDKTASRRSLGRLRAGGRTALFDSIGQLTSLMERVPGKKAIVVLTDGGDNASVFTRQSAAQRARKAGIPVFAIAEGDALRDDAAGELLNSLSEATGGHMYKAKRSKDIERVFMDIAADLQNGYLLGFQAPPAQSGSAWHKLDVRIRNTSKPLKVRARTGYSFE